MDWLIGTRDVQPAFASNKGKVGRQIGGVHRDPWQGCLPADLYPLLAGFRVHPDIRGARLQLQISDYDLFWISCDHYGGCEVSSADVERAFSAYLRNGTVPVWVRDFVRKELVKFEQGELEEPEQFGIMRRTVGPHEKLLGWTLIVLSVVLTMLFSWFAAGSDPF